MEDIVALFNDGKKRMRKDAARELGISERHFRAQIEKLNEMKYPIISEGDGFFMAITVEQIHNARARLESAYHSIGKRIESLNKIESEFIARQQGTSQLTLL
jgi:hypothetical protein